MTIYNLISFSGIFVLMFCAWVFSKNRWNVNWRVVFWGVVLQLVFAFFIFFVPAGLWVFHWVNDAVIKVISFANEGMYFVFGPLAVSPGTTGRAGEQSVGFILAFQALPAAIFFSSLMALLYYFKIMQKVVKVFSYIFTKLMHISGAEALCTSSNIVVGVESVFTIRPYIEAMTLSELCVVLTAGMATIASTVIAIYVSVLSRNFPAIAGHLVSASVLSAPAAVVMSKLLYPEDEHPKTLGTRVEGQYEQYASWIESAITGAQEGVKLVVGIIALLLAFLSLLAMCNWFIGVAGNWVGGFAGIQPDLSLQKLLSYIFYPFAFIIGVPLSDIPKVSMMLGERSILTELVPYQHLAQYITSGQMTNPRSIVLSAYALCGFAHIASLAIFIGGISAIVPGRTKDLAKIGFRALFAATLACLMTGAVAGVFITEGSNALIRF